MKSNNSDSVDESMFPLNVNEYDNYVTIIKLSTKLVTLQRPHSTLH